MIDQVGVSALCWISLIISAMSRAETYSITTECSVKLPGRGPGSMSERRRKLSTASSIVSAWQRGGKHRQQLLQGHRLAQDRQPHEHALLRGREADVLLIEQGAYSAEDHLTLLQERRNLAIEEIYDGLRHDFEGQRIARVGLDQLELLWTCCPATPFSANNCWHASASSRARRKARTGARLPSSGTSSLDFSRLVSSQQL